MAIKFNGRYQIRNGSLVAVHDNVGHTIAGGEAGVFKIDYDELGNAIGENMQGYDLLRAVEFGASQPRTKVVGCDLCERENP